MEGYSGFVGMQSGLRVEILTKRLGMLPGSASQWALRGSGPETATMIRGNYRARYRANGTQERAGRSEKVWGVPDLPPAEIHQESCE